jgi:AcrR family transcriptional regulator
MTDQQTPHDAKDRLLAAADRLFMERGYTSVTLRDIANAVGIKHASIYYHAPGGKQQLFLEVIERTFHAHQIGLTAALATSDTDIHKALYAVARWLLEQPPMNLLRMTQSDMAKLDQADAMRIGALAQASLLDPISNALSAAHARGEIAVADTDLLAGGLLSMLQGLHGVPDIAFSQKESRWHNRTRLDMARGLIDTLIYGLLPRAAAST